MLQELMNAKQEIGNGNVEAAAEIVEVLKELPRKEDGSFDLSGQGADEGKLAGYAYPVYAAYESTCNKKEGYPDLVAQIKALDHRLKEDLTHEKAAAFLALLIDTIEYVSPQIYEYYRDLVDLFRTDAKLVIEAFYEESGRCKQDAEWSEAADSVFRAAVKKASAMHVLLAEKYEQYC